MSEEIVEQVESLIDSLVAEAVEIRFSTPPMVNPSDAVPVQTHALYEIRSSLDRLDEILVKVLRVRAKARRSAFTAEAELESSFDQALDALLSSPTKRGGEFISAKERASEVNLTILNEKRVAFIARRASDTCDHAAEIIKKLHRDLDSIRQDISLVVRSKAFESSIDR